MALWLGNDDVQKVLSMPLAKVAAPRSDQERIFYKANTGLGIWYSSVGARVYDLARQRGLGKEMDDDLFLETDDDLFLETMRP
jgi:hypothetical protein